MSTLMLLGSMLACVLCLAPTAQAADDCPNAEIRAQQGASNLPNCLAYEMVSPPYTAGQRALAPAMSDDGTRVFVYSLGGFADTPNLPDLGVHYEANRSPSGWEIDAIAPPATSFPFIGTYSAWDYSSDLGKTLWVVNTNDDVGTKRFTAIVRNPDGVFHTAGPGLDDGTYTPAAVGTSEDLSRVVLMSRARPALTDGTIDTRGTTRNTLMVSERKPDGSLGVSQVGYRSGATMFPTCAIALGGAVGSASTTSRGSMSRDGSTVIFTTVGLSSCTTPAMQRVWAKVGTADPIDLSASQCTTACGTEQRTTFEGAGKDASRVYFTTEQKLLDGDQDTTKKSDLYEYDFNAVGNKLRSVTSGVEAAGAGVVRVSRVSPDGSHAYFVANGRALAPANARGLAPQPGEQNLYVYHRADGVASGTIKFIAPLPGADTHLSSPDDRRFIQTSDNGRFALFRSVGDLTGDRGVGDSFGDLFHYDAEADELKRVWSSDPAHNGAARTQGSIMESLNATNANANRRTVWKTPNITDDGSLVAFSTAESLSPDDVNDQRDVYLWEAATGHLTQLTSGRASTPAGLSAISGDGETILFTTSWPMLPQHRGGSVAAYVLRRGGGFPDTTPPPTPPCVGDACQGPIASRPVADVVGSVDFTGGGNAQAPGGRVAAAVSVSGVKPISGLVARLKVRVPAPGRITVSGAAVRRASKPATKAATYTLRVALDARAKRALKKRKDLKVKVRVAFSSKSGRSASKTVTLIFKARKGRKR